MVAELLLIVKRSERRSSGRCAGTHRDSDWRGRGRRRLDHLEEEGEEPGAVTGRHQRPRSGVRAGSSSRHPDQRGSVHRRGCRRSRDRSETHR